MDCSSHEWKKLNDAFICENSQSISEEILWEENVDIRQWIEDERILLGSHQSNMLAPSEELIAEFDKVWKSLGGVQSYQFCCW
ncbi:14522_t:CDS:2 [Funneliformis geosporum]|uniref:14522_t:CDS:1 n=1 Tax=Funneliformis geosporum TaxID=1117311 RepID=A0A9W4SZK4_9GLOM|nr:14522_t:CDS:2 [Funneliformis geosporum]